MCHERVDFFLFLFSDSPYSDAFVKTVWIQPLLAMIKCCRWHASLQWAHQQQQQQQQHISNNTAKVGRDPDQPKEMNQSADPEYKMQAQTFHVTQKSRHKGPVDPKQEDQDMQLSQNSKCKMQKTISFQTSKSDDPRQQHNAKIKLIP